MSQEKQPTVLLIEADPSLRRLIALGLQYRDMYVIESESLEHLSTLDSQQIDLLVLDQDGNVPRNSRLSTSARAPLTHSRLSNVPAILLTWENPSSPMRSVVVATNMTYLTKPFDARILHETIDQILLAKQAAEARAEELLLATYARQTSPSIWPIITAAGLLLAFIGMMLQIALTIAGLLIVAVALLLWTMGNRQASTKVALV